MFVGSLTIAPSDDNAFVEMLQRDGTAVITSALAGWPTGTLPLTVSVLEARRMDPKFDIVCRVSGSDYTFITENVEERIRNIVEGLNTLGGGTFRVGVQLHLGPRVIGSTTYDRHVFST